ncbi:MAG: sigma-70 family RNA polymerase sigma factor [Clostridia bacterium]|nr:sigma-70 family RNA polymerase sigma factor [Clostridia bacterium]
MEDVKIIDLYFARDTQAITETDQKYGKYCYSVAFNVLNNREDSSECVNDTYNVAWNTIPPNRPTILSAFLGKITRRLSIDLWRKKNTKSRGGDQTNAVLDELQGCIPSANSVESEMENRRLTEIINGFLRSLKKEERVVFVLRYWHLYKVEQIAKKVGMSSSKVKSMLLRLRNKLFSLLNKEELL